MKRISIALTALLGLFLVIEPLAAEGPTTLWEIGKPDNSAAEFHLAPDGFDPFPPDPIYIVGISDPGRDWPYAQPGPVDYWGGRKDHTITILFALEAPPAEGTCRLIIDLLDTHPQIPPTLIISVNDYSKVEPLPKGGGKESIKGDWSSLREHRIVMEVPSNRLKEGPNQVQITTTRESWILYDCIAFETPGELHLGKPADLTRIREVGCPQYLKRSDGGLLQTLQFNIRHIGQPRDALLRVIPGVEQKFALKTGDQRIEIPLPAGQDERRVIAELILAGEVVDSTECAVPPARKWDVYILPHSHVDIGYTQLQSVVEALHWDYFEQAIVWARETADDPEGCRFKWNVEVLWAVDSYLLQASEEKRKEFVEAVEKGWIGLDALYGNELTGLCRPEELVRLTDYAGRLQREYGVGIDSAMISDVPGYSWGIVPVLAKSGVDYFSIGANRSARLGATLTAWGDRPFYWVSQSGQEKILTWVAGEGYSWFHHGRIEDDERILLHIEKLVDRGYPYDVLQVRYSIGGDNGPPDRGLCDYVRNWNDKYAYPRLHIATTSEAMHAFEERHGKEIPAFAGDFTPYWEDGAASSALETSLNRGAAERLNQAETLWAMLDPDTFPEEEFYQAWRNVILYDEHTWGAHTSVTEPDTEFTRGQWNIKQAFASDADQQSKALLDSSLKPIRAKEQSSNEFLVFNTQSWPRSDVVFLSQIEAIGNRVLDSEGNPVPSQRLSTGELAFLAQSVPPFGSKKFVVVEGEPPTTESLEVEGNKLSNSDLRIVVDQQTGALTSLYWESIRKDLVDHREGVGLNEYFYVPGSDPKDAVRTDPVTLRVKEKGPLVVSLSANSHPQGCYHLNREIRLFLGLNRIDLIDELDKRRIRDKEGIHFAFPFDIPGGQIRMDIGWGVIRPDHDQLPGACKNWFAVQRWVDVSNQDYGVTWATVDAPLVEVGGITAETPWIEQLGPTQTFYSYVMNNYWFTNYKADQEGLTTFRYSLKPHLLFDSTEANQFGIEWSQPLIVAGVAKDAPEVPSFLRVDPSSAIVSSLKPTRDGEGWEIRLYGASGAPQKVRLDLSGEKEWTVYRSDLEGLQGERVDSSFDLAPYEMSTFRIQ